MLTFLTRRLLLLPLVLFGVVTIVFSLIHLIPGDAVDIMLGDYARAADKELLRHEMGMDQPLWIQYGRYLKGVMQGDLGISISSHQPVLHEILARVPASAELMAGAMVIALVIAVPLGILAALRPYGLIDGFSMAVAFIGISMPNFWLGPLLILFFSIQLDWLPVNERGGLSHLILPALTLGASLAAILARMLRSSLMEVLSEEYILNARAKGLSETRVVIRHALANALLPVITIIGLQVGVLLSGAIITESIFDWPGLGTLLLEAIYSRNYPLVQGCILFIAAIYVLINLLTDVAYAWADPRVRLN